MTSTKLFASVALASAVAVAAHAQAPAATTPANAATPAAAPTAAPTVAPAAPAKPSASSSAPKKEEKKDEAPEFKITAGGKIEGGLHVYDSSRKNTPDLGLSAIRFKIKATEGIVSAYAEARALDFYNFDNTTPNDADYRNGIYFARAWASVKLPTDTEIKLGRSQEGTPSPYAKGNSLYFINNYGVKGEGVFVKQSLKASELSLDLGAAYLNKAGFLNPNNQYRQTQDDARGYGFYADSFYNLGAGKLHATVSTVYSPKTYKVKAAVPAVGTTPATPESITVNSASHTEIALGYEIGKWGSDLAIGVNAGLDTKGRSKKGVREEGRVIKEDENSSSTDDSTKQWYFGGGVSGSSALFGIKDVLQQGAVVVYGLDMGFTPRKTTGSDSVATSAWTPKTNFHSLVGWKTAREFEIDLEVFHDRQKENSDTFDSNRLLKPDGTLATSKTAADIHFVWGF